MRIAIREQLTTLMIVAVLVGLAVVSVPTWIYVNQFVINIKRDGLALTASLKASRITAELELLQQSCITISSRILVQRALVLFYNGEEDESAWNSAQEDVLSALTASSLTGLLQARIYSRNTTGGPAPLLNVTAGDISSVLLPYPDNDGNPIYLSDTEDGYPKELYPNITYVDLGRPSTVKPGTQAFAAEAFPDVRISQNQGLLLGPLIINSTFALVSLSVPIRDNNDTRFILGYMTIVATASSLIQIRDSKEGLGDTGMVLLVGPKTPWNRFDASLPPSNATFTPDKTRFAEVPVHFVVPAKAPAGQEYRHQDTAHPSSSVDNNYSFPVKDYPAAFDSLTDQVISVNNQSSIISTTNEQNFQVAVGYARTSTPLVNWTVLVEQTRDEAFVPIVTLRNILLGTVFGTAGFLLILVFPCAHISVLPIRRLKDATEKTIKPPGYEDGYYDSEVDPGEETPASGNVSSRSQRSERGLIANVRRFINRKTKAAPSSDNGREAARRIFKIPGKVEDKKKYFITDELTELTKTFNDMSDELVKQYTSLDEKVAQRTRELEISKKAAEAANESKTLFIANISHELKTPLNGILGMCAVCMEENDIVRIKQSLKTLYKSGDLLLHLLEDLLSFSKNQIGQQLSLEEKEFRLADIRSQILIIFDKQAREGSTKLSVNFISSDGVEVAESSQNEKLPAIGPGGIGRLKDMCLWGDQHRVLQVIINLVSNSLKFTPAGGSVSVRIKCLGEVDTSDESRASSSVRSSVRVGRSRNRVGSAASTNSKATTTTSVQYKGSSGTALSINPMDPKATPHVQVRERSRSPPPPPNAKPFWFEFEVEDTGPGIPENMQQRVFEPFVQGDLGLSKKYGGTGLGLSICHQLATLMGGTITLKSTVGVGSTFTMRIPLKYVKNRPSSTASSSVKSRSTSVEATEPANIQRNGAAKPSETTATTTGTAPSAAAAAATTAVLDPKPRLVGLSLPFFSTNLAPKTTNPKNAEARIAAIQDAVAKKEGQGKLRVLVADDNSTNVEVVSRMLKLEDVVDVTIAKDGQEAYDLVKATMENNQRFDLIFMDIQMPNLDGLQSTRLIRKMGYKSPIVALTAFSEESNVKECIESGMDEFLSKPIRRPALKQVLRKFATIPEEPETASLSTKRTRSQEGMLEVTAADGKEDTATNGSAPVAVST